MIDGEITALLYGLLLIHLFPGPDRILVINHSFLGGSRAGVSTSIGISIATLVSALICYLIISFSAQKDFFPAFQWGGSLLLAMLGLKHIINGLKPVNNILNNNAPAGGFFRSGFLLHLINPMAYIFPISFFPQFISKTNVPLAFASLSIFSIALALSINIVFSFVSFQLAKRFYSDNTIRGIKLATGILFIFFAGRTLLGF